MNEYSLVPSSFVWAQVDPFTRVARGYICGELVKFTEITIRGSVDYTMELEAPDGEESTIVFGGQREARAWNLLQEWMSR